MGKRTRLFTKQTINGIISKNYWHIVLNVLSLSKKNKMENIFYKGVSLFEINKKGNYILVYT